MKKIILISLFFVFVASFFPIPLLGQSGLYNTFSGLIYCEPSACVHEVGHKLDDKSGWISKSDEFKEAVINIGLDFQIETIGPQETYAEIYAFADGKAENMPVPLRYFYNWDLSEELLRGFD